ncbi:YbdD/YjiX family protein [bacterium]|nr:MAG: YbdD/YjiX family protein [bacterium]
MAAPSVKQFLSAGFSLLRGVTGDDAYEKYVAHHERSQPGLPPMSAAEFYQAQLEQKWSCVNGCC